MPNRITRYRLTILLALCSMLTGVLLPLGQALAFTPNYNPNNLIDNPTFTDTGTMSAQVIQSFLSNIGSGIAGYSDVEACDSTIAAYYTHCGQRISAAQIIYDASQAYGLNPRAILATMEKEQSLVTDPTPSSSQINCAMGYNSCTNYVGFFTQVDNGTWILRYNYEGAFQHATWKSWSPGGNYPCATAKSGYYSAGLYPGNTVTFADSGGTAETVTLANAATASLYCYTPYVGPYSVTGYSGSYNFVYYFQLWFGSTQTSVQYGWGYDSQGIYSDSSRIQTFNRGNAYATVAPGGKVYVELKAINQGYQTWSSSVVHLGTSHSTDRCSVFGDSSWLSSAACQRIPMVQSSVVPGDIATFDFSMTAPQTPGTYREYFNLVADGITWMNDPGANFVIDVVQPAQADSSATTTLTPGSSLSLNNHLISSDHHSIFDMQGDGNAVLYTDGTPRWSTGTPGYRISKLVMQTDGNLVLYGTDNVADWSSGTAGNSGAYFVLQSDGNAVIYNSSNQPLWSSGTSGNPNGLNYVQHGVGTATLYPLQQLSTANRNYRLIFQSDGNLVLYSPNRATWSSGTAGKASAHLAMQGDGNLVIYDQSGKALWASGTAGQGSSGLVMQDDGNLVIYNSVGRPTWSSGTAGVQ